jgi:hypothetical protein
MVFANSKKSTTWYSIWWSIEIKKKYLGVAYGAIF